MYRRILAVLMSVALAVSGLTITPKEVDAAVHSSGGSGSWSLVWSDEFNQSAGTSPNGSYWQYDIGNGSSGWGNNEIQYYTNSTNNVAIADINGAVDGKALRITAKREGGQITSGRIKSLDKQYVKYGKIEARIRLSNGMQPGVWPAFWMMGNDINTNGMGWPLCGEIDILEHRNQEREIISTLHWNVGSSYNHGWYGSELNGQYGYVNSIDDWHTYAVEWYEDCMKFFLDGNCFETITLTADMAEEFHKPHFILLNLAIGGPNTPFTKNTTVTADWQESSMYVDYVRVYQGSDGNFFRAKSNSNNIVTTASPTAGMTACASDGWYGAGAVWDYNFSTSWAQASGFYSGGSQNDFTIYISNPSLYEWGSMIRARQGVTAGHTYNYTINYNSSSAGSALVKEDVSSTGDQVVGIVSGNGTINGSFTAGSGQTEAQILMDLRGFAAGTKLKITGLTLTDTTQGSIVTTTQAQVSGMTTCTNDAAWHSAGNVWDYLLAGDWAQAAGYYSGGSQNDFAIQMSSASLYAWGAMIRANQSVTPGHSYNFTINYNSTAAGTVLVKEDVSSFGDQEHSIVSGNGSISGSFTAGTDQSAAQILMDLRGIGAGTKLTITGLTLTDTTPAEVVTTTKAPVDDTPTTIDWSGIEYAGDGAGGGAYSNKYKFYCENSGVSLVNIQESFGTEAGLYVTFPSGLSSSSLSGYAIQGAGALLYLSSFTAKETKFTVTDAGGTTYTCYVYYADGTGVEEETTIAPETTVAPETTTVAPEIPGGYTAATVNEWAYAGNWGCYFGNWAGSASGSYQLVSDKNYKLYVETANTGADWLIQACYNAPAITGHTYRVTATVTTDVAGSIGMKEDLSNEAIAQVYTDLPVGTTVITGEYTVTQDAMKVMFELGRGIAAGTTLSFDNIVIEDITSGEVETTTVVVEEPTASDYVRTVHIDTYGGTISSDEKIDCGIVIMDKVGGDSYEDSVVYDTIDSTGTIKVRGNSTALADKKPYNISFESKTEVFGMGKAKKWSLLANAFDKSLVRNRLAMEFATDLGLAYTSESTYVDLYVNGEYYGNYLLIESVEAGSDRVDIDTDNESDALVEREAERNEEGVVYFTTSRYGIRFAMGDPEEIDTTSAHFTSIVNKFNGFEAALASGNYDAVAEYIDVDSFANFYIVNELFKNVDFNFSSTRFYIKDGKIYAGPLWDLDLSSGNALSSYYPDYYPNGNSAQGLWCQSFTWFKVLMEIPEFKTKVGTRYTEVQPLITNMISGTTGNSIDALTSTYATAFAMNYTAKSQGGAGWTVSQADSADYYSKASEARWATHDVALDYLKDWLTNRNAYLLEQFEVEGIEINGFQISTLVEGIRTVYSVSDTIGGQDVTEVGLIYGLGVDGFSQSDMVVGSTNKLIYQSAGTEENGRMSEALSMDASYTMTMTFGVDSVESYTATYYVRAYAKLADGSIAYTDIEDYSIYDVADVLYQNGNMSTAAGHQYLYDKILTKVDSAYKEIEYNYSNSLAPKSF